MTLDFFRGSIVGKSALGDELKFPDSYVKEEFNNA